MLLWSFILTCWLLQLGVSNFPLDMLTKFVQLCKEKGYIQPTIYQGLYNVVSRGHEQLFPFLRENGIQFVAHRYVCNVERTYFATEANI